MISAHLLVQTRDFSTFAGTGARQRNAMHTSIRKKHSRCLAPRNFEAPESLPDRSAPQTGEPLRQVSLPDRLPDRSSQPYRPRRQPHDAPRCAKTMPETHVDMSFHSFFRFLRFWANELQTSVRLRRPNIPQKCRHVDTAAILKMANV